MLTLVAMRALVGRVPRMAWLILGAIALLMLGVYSVERHGERVGEVKLHRIALADSTKQQRAVIDTVTMKVTVAVRDANTHEQAATPLRARAHAAVADTSNHVPPAVIAAVDSALAEDAITIAKKDTALAAAQALDSARIKLDTLEEHAIVLKPPDAGTSVVDVVKDIGIVVLVIEVVRWAAQLFRR